MLRKVSTPPALSYTNIYRLSKYNSYNVFEEGTAVCSPYLLQVTNPSQLLFLGHACFSIVFIKMKPIVCGCNIDLDFCSVILFHGSATHLFLSLNKKYMDTLFLYIKLIHLLEDI